MDAAAPGRLERTLGLLVAVPVALIVVLTFADVFARYLFAAPIRGSLEIIEFAMALTIFTALPLVTRSRGHVTVSLIDGVVPRGLRPLHRALCDAVGVVALALLAWRLGVQGLDDLEARTQTIVLQLPKAPLAFAMGALAALSAVLLAMLAWRALRGADGDGGAADTGTRA